MSARPQPLPKSSKVEEGDVTEPSGADLSKVNMGHSSSAQKAQLTALLGDVNEGSLFAVDPQRVDVARGKPHRLRLEYSKCRPFFAGTRRYSTEQGAVPMLWV